MIKKIFALALLSLLLVYCSSSSEVQKDAGKDEAAEVDAYSPTINLNVDNITSWIGENLAKKKKFHVSGDVIITDSDKYELGNIELQKVNIYQNGELYYSVFPTVQLKNNDDSQKEILFSTIQGLDVNPMFNYENSFMVEIIFIESGEEFSYRIENNMVQKVQ